MRIAITDFDGTLYRDHIVSPEDRAAIDDWRRTGDLFGIATGRDCSMTVHEIRKWRIPFDFLVCNNGAIIYDRKLAILASRELSSSVTQSLLRHSAAEASIHWQFCIDGVVKLYRNSDRSWFPGLGVPYVDIDKEEALTATRVQQISFAYDSGTECDGWVAQLAEEMKREITLHRNAAFVDVTGPNIDKATGIADLVSIMQWKPTDIYVIGDAENDLQMIRTYNGFTVPAARQVVKQAAAAVFSSAGTMLTAVRDGTARKVFY